jgi:hypothetical protein
MNTVISNNKRLQKRHKYLLGWNNSSYQPSLPKIGEDALPYLNWVEAKRQRLMWTKITFGTLIILGAILIILLV